MPTKKQLEDIPYYIPRAKELAVELGATIRENDWGRKGMIWDVVYNDKSTAVHNPEAVYMFLKGIRNGLENSKN